MNDLEPDGLGDLQSIKRTPGMGRPKKINWGEEYQGWPIEKRLQYAERLASTMNHAADMLQQERNQLLVIVKQQEEQIKSQTKQYLAQGDFMHQRISKEGADKQVLYEQIVALTAEVKQLKKNGN